MNETAENNDLIQQLADLSLAGEFFNEDLLRKHNLFTTDALNLIFYNDVLDQIDFREAIDALPSYRERINRRRKKIDTIRADSISPGFFKTLKWLYPPYAILDDIGQYGVLLRQRNNYIPISQVIQKLNLKEKYSRASIYRLLKKFDIKAMYSMKYIKTECLDILIMADAGGKKTYKKEMNYGRNTYYRYKKMFPINAKQEETNKEDTKSLGL